MIGIEILLIVEIVVIEFCNNEERRDKSEI